MDRALATALGIDDTETLTALDSLDVDPAVEKTLLDRAQALATSAAAPAPQTDVKTLASDAAAAGKILLDTEDYATLRRDATAGAAAAAELHRSRFDTAFQKALDDRKVAAGERETLEKFYALDAAETLKALDARQPIFAPTPTGPPALELDMNQPTDPQAAIANGVHPGQHDVDRKVKAALAEKGLSMAAYPKMLDDMIARGEV